MRAILLLYFSHLLQAFRLTYGTDYDWGYFMERCLWHWLGLLNILLRNQSVLFIATFWRVFNHCGYFFMSDPCPFFYISHYSKTSYLIERIKSRIYLYFVYFIY